MTEQTAAITIASLDKESLNSSIDIETRNRFDKLEKIFPRKVVLLSAGTKLYRQDNRPQERVDFQGIATRSDPLYFTDLPHSEHTNMSATSNKPLLVLDVRKDEGLTMDETTFNRLLVTDEDPQESLKILGFDGFIGTGAAKNGVSDFIPEGAREIVILPEAVRAFDNGIELYKS